jgi:site-specific DNA-methyltransferase (cytosine-N4-specific)
MPKPSAPPEAPTATLHLADLPAAQQRALEQLARTDWTFADADTQQHAHSLHPYPAKFIPQIPRTLIDVLHPGDDSPVLDPFCGSGTALLEATVAGVPAVGVDTNPLAVLLSKVKSTPPHKEVKPAAARVCRAVRAGLDQDRRAEVPDIPRLNHWFAPEIARTVAALVEQIRAAEVTEAARDVLRVALSGILVTVSRQESNVRYAAVENDVTPAGVVDRFERNAREVIQKLNEVRSPAPLFPDRDLADVQVLHGDARELNTLPIEREVGLVVTSPPYPNAYEYWLYHKYRMYWLGMDPQAAKNSEIGARPFYSRKNGLTAEDFADDMRRCFAGLYELLASERYACFVVGNSKIRGEIVDNTQLLTRVAEENGFTLRATLPRDIPSTSKSFNPKNSRAKNENVLVFQRP